MIANMQPKTVKLNSDEFIPILNILNEVSNGFYIEDFEKVIGVNRKFVDELWDRISKNKGKKEAILLFNNIELEVIKNSFVEVFKEFEEGEFHPRIGRSIPEMKEVQNKILSK